jgi:hypothetical protein
VTNQEFHVTEQALRRRARIGRFGQPPGLIDLTLGILRRAKTQQVLQTNIIDKQTNQAAFRLCISNTLLGAGMKYAKRHYEDFAWILSDLRVRQFDSRGRIGEAIRKGQFSVLCHKVPQGERGRGMKTDDPTANEMRTYLRQLDSDADKFDVEGAIYWFSSDWHGGQASNLYSALSTSEYRPGACARWADTPAMIEMVEALEAEYCR